MREPSQLKTDAEGCRSSESQKTWAGHEDGSKPLGQTRGRALDFQGVYAYSFQRVKNK